MPNTQTLQQAHQSQKSQRKDAARRRNIYDYFAPLTFLCAFALSLFGWKR